MVVGPTPESSLLRSWGKAGKLSNLVTFSLTGESMATGLLPGSEKESRWELEGRRAAWWANRFCCRTGRDLPEGSP